MADAGNTFQRARRIALGPTPRVIRETLSATDRDDFYRFNLGSTSSIDTSVFGIPRGNNFDLLLYNRQRRLISSSRRPRNSAEAIRLNLNAGLWYLRVQWRPGSNRASRPYRLRFSAVPDQAGESLSTARALGNLPANTPVSFNDFVSPGDTSDFYRFSVTERTNLSTTLTPFAPTANFNLLDANGTFIEGTNAAGTGARTVQRTLLPGTYYVAVNNGGAGSNYSLQLTNSPIPDEAGNDFSTTTTLNPGFQQSTFSGFVGAGDPADFFRFDSTIGGDLSLNLSGTTTDLSVTLYNSQGSALNTQTGNLIIPNLQPGSYFVEIRPVNPNLNSTYTLTSQLVPPDQVGDDVATSTLVTGSSTPPFDPIDATSRSYPDFAGFGDDDVFRFDFTGQPYNFLSISLGGLSANLDMEFFEPISNTRIFSSRGSTSQDVFQGTVGAGVYYLRVYSPTPGTGSAYNLSMSVNSSATSRPSIVRDVFPGGDSNAGLLREVRSLSSLFFTASDGEQLGLWRSTGSLETTFRVDTFESITDMQAVGNTLYIVGQKSAATGVELYKWTPQGGTALVSDITPGAEGTFFESLTAMEDSSFLYFLGSPEETPSAIKLYRTDGTSVTEITNIGSTPSNFTVVGTTLYYQATGIFNGSPADNTTLWRVSGNATSAQELTQFTENGATVTLRAAGQLQAIGNDLYFTASQFNGTFANQELRRLTGNGNTILTFEVNGDDPGRDDVLAGSPFIETRSYAVAGNYLYFTAASIDGGVELFRADQTSGVVEALPELNTGTGVGSNPSNLIVYQDRLFFTATADDGDLEMYVIDAPNSATLPTYDPLNPGASTIVKVDLLSPGSSGLNNFRIASDKLYFVATRSGEGTEVYTYTGDGSFASLTNPDNYEVAWDIAPGTASSAPNGLIVVGDTSGVGTAGRIYFTADDSTDPNTSNREVWVI